MIFADLPLAEAEGAILAHSLRDGVVKLKKGHVLTAEDLAALAEEGFETVTAAKLEPGDVEENAAAAELALALEHEHLDADVAATGRVNIHSTVPGLAMIDVEAVNRINALDEAITLATLPAYSPVSAGQMVATVKIIPFATQRRLLDEAIAIAREHGPVLRMAPWRPMSAKLIQTRLPGTLDKMLDKTVRVTAERLADLGIHSLRETRCDHAAAPLAAELKRVVAEGADLILIAGASAITDRRDVLPAGVERAGGVIDHLGMPVDPGNLLLMARLGKTQVLGLPGCARSPKLNGFDWVLQRMAAGLPVTREVIAGMGVGGLLVDIPTRPRPRDAKPASEIRPPRIAALILAAGQSRRMGAGRNKLLEPWNGQPMVVAAVDAALASRADSVFVVTGHEAERVSGALGERRVERIHNADFADGLSASLKAGLAALPPDFDAVLVALGDMPRVSTALLNRLIAAYNPAQGRAIIVPTHGGKRGNPILWDRRFFADMQRVAGDVGARHLIGDHAELVHEVEVEDDSVLLDIDTPAALAAAVGS